MGGEAGQDRTGQDRTWAGQDRTGAGQDRTGQDRTWAGQDRTGAGQDRTGQDRTGQDRSWTGLDRTGQDRSWTRQDGLAGTGHAHATLRCHGPAQGALLQRAEASSITRTIAPHAAPHAAIAMNSKTGQGPDRDGTGQEREANPNARSAHAARHIYIHI